MAQNMGMSQGMEQSLNPKMIAFYELLQQPNVELEQAIETELQDNPALEVSAERVCPACGSTMLSAQCRECGYKLTKEDEDAFESGELGKEKILDLAVEAAPMEKATYNGDEDGFDVMARLTATETLAEHLRWLWRMSCNNPGTLEIGEQLIGCINDDGYLDTDLETLSEGLGIPLETLEEVLADIQNLEPAGVGARTLRECLRLQLVHREKGKDADIAQLALRLIDDHWQPLARHSYEDIARKLKTSIDRVQEGADFVRNELTPYPGRQFRPSWHTNSPQAAGRVRPDVEIKRQEDGKGYLVEVVESRSLGLRVNAVYRQLWDAMRKDPVGYSSKDREHVQIYLTRAREFIDNLNQRRKTLKLIISKPTGASLSTPSVPRKSRSPSAITLPTFSGTSTAVATDFSVTPAQATNASSSMSPEHKLETGTARRRMQACGGQRAPGLDLAGRYRHGRSSVPLAFKRDECSLEGSLL